MKLSIIGAGNMGGAIARGLSNSKAINASDIHCADLSTDVLDKIKAVNPAINTTTDNAKVIAGADIIVIAVKPWLLEAVINEIKHAADYKKQIFVSIVAGVDFEKLRGFLEKDNEDAPAIFRVIPNTAIEVKESVNFVSSCNATNEQNNTITELFNELGPVFFVEERLINAGMTLASCGIAFAFRYIRAAVEGAVELGLSPKDATKIELQTLKGAIALLEANNSHPEAEIDKVTTPGGITIKGLNAMEEAGFTNAVIKGLKASSI